MTDQGFKVLAPQVIHQTFLSKLNDAFKWWKATAGCVWSPADILVSPMPFWFILWEVSRHADVFSNQQSNFEHSETSWCPKKEGREHWFDFTRLIPATDRCQSSCPCRAWDGIWIFYTIKRMILRTTRHRCWPTRRSRNPDWILPVSCR